MKSLKVNPISQRDPRWRWDNLGHGSGSIDKYGCLLVCYTMLLNYFGTETTPDKVNEKMKAVGGFVGDTKNLWVWKKADKIWKTEYQGSFDWNNSKVLEWIEKKIPPIIKVDGRPIGGLSHYVLAVGDHKIADPWTGKIEPFSKYKPLGYHIYTKGEDMGDQSEELKECLRLHKKLVEEAREHQKTISSQAKELTELKKEKEKLINQAVQAVEKYEKVEKLREKWHGLYKDYKRNLETCKTDRASLETKITKMEEKSLITASNRTLLLQLISNILGIKK